MVTATRARTAETLTQPSLRLRLRAPYFYPDTATLARGARLSRASHHSTVWIGWERLRRQSNRLSLTFVLAASQLRELLADATT
jgi:hypothetical protein